MPASFIIGAGMALRNTAQGEMGGILFCSHPNWDTESKIEAAGQRLDNAPQASLPIEDGAWRGPADRQAGRHPRC